MKDSQMYPPVSLHGTEKRILFSEIVGVEYDLFINLPFGYDESQSNYPALFCLDANRGFGLVSDTVNILNRPSNEIPPVVVVGIGNPIDGLEDWVVARNRDYTPTRIPEFDQQWIERLTQLTGRDDIVVRSGGAGKFLEFLDKELFPFIESEYNVSSNDRALFGYSLGGLFTLFTLFRQPNLFHRYFAGSPAINWDEPFVFGSEEEYFDSQNDLPAKLFMSVGELEQESMIGNFEKMSNSLYSRNYPNLEIATKLFQGESHASCYPGAVSRALKVLYKD